MSRQKLQPLIWLARRCTSSRPIGIRARLIVFATALSASIAPSTAKAGLVIRAVINMAQWLLSHRVRDVGQALDPTDDEDVTRWTHSKPTALTCTPSPRGSSARA